MPVLSTLRKLVATLRDSELGCPWTLQQNLASLVPFTIEEAFEVGASIENGDWEGLASELGDLLYQIVFYCQIAEENGMFDMDDVADKLERKLQERHPHVFANTVASSRKEAIGDWNEIKRVERRRKFGEDSSELDDVPRALPSLTRAHKIQKRASVVGFDWKSYHGPRTKVDEELEELDELLHKREAISESAARCREELGDVLFSVVNLARHLKIDPEYALTTATDKFVYRFRELEKLLRQEGKQIEDVSSSDLEKGWRFVKTAGPR
jgi:ATP diphosphatase